MNIYENERIDEVNDSLSLIQKTDGLTFGTDALLLAAYVRGRHVRGVELGSGSGIISMLLITRKKVQKITAYEVQEEYADLTRRNAEQNHLEEVLTATCLDVRHIPSGESEDVVFTNPPYMKTDSGKSNRENKKNAARHEVFGGIYDFCQAARRTLKYGGAFYAVYRPDRLVDIILAMRETSLEPKRITFVHADSDSESSMVLIEAKKGGKGGAQLTKPLIIYKDRTHKEYTDDMKYIMELGSFPDKFER